MLGTAEHNEVRPHCAPHSDGELTILHDDGRRPDKTTRAGHGQGYGALMFHSRRRRPRMPNARRWRERATLLPPAFLKQSYPQRK
jgi:hypothetical protein